ncbi:hypothetical protein [Caudoviricetes sp.]|nr:hypothetical protein [Caudoviricetes sp.]
MPNHPKTVSIKGFKGLNNNISPESTPQDYLKKALNINLDKTGGISKRKGYVKKDSSIFTSLWASENNLGCYAVRTGNLVKVNPDYTFTTIRSNVGQDKISFEEIDDKIYYASNSVTGIIDDGVNKSWGVPKNTVAPLLTTVSGNLTKGTYRVSFTYVRDDGIESGTGISSSKELLSTGGISIVIPTHADPSITFARVYCSTPDGIILYYNGLSVLGTSYTISSVSSSSNPLKMFNLDAAQTGHIVRYYRGRIYIAKDNILWYSEPFKYQHFNLSSNYFEFPDRIREVLPVEDGIWICSDKLYYLSGDNPDDFKKSTKEPISVVEGTATKMSGSYLRIDNTPIGYKWLISSDLGIFVLFNQGLVINLTSTNVELNKADSGTSLFLQDEGMNQYLSILKTNQNPNNSVVGDLVETSIVRNGIIIP